MSLVTKTNEGLEPRMVGPPEPETSDGHHRSQPDNSGSTIKGSSVVVAGKYKYIFKSRNQRNKLETWRCSLKPSCKATIAVTDYGDVIWASGGHDHPALSGQQISSGYPNNELVNKNVKNSTSFNTIYRLRGKPGETGDVSDCDSTIQKPGSKSAENVAFECIGEEKNRLRDSAQLETGSSEDKTLRDLESALPKLGPAFSVAGCNGMIMTNSANQEPKPYESNQDEASTGSESQPLSIEPNCSENQIGMKGSSGQSVQQFHSQPSNVAENDSQPASWNPKSAVLHGFSVTKNTQTMRNILAQALERMDEGSLDKPVRDIAGPSKGAKRRRTQNTEPKEEMDIEAKMEEEWQWQFIKEETAEEEEEDDDSEINVDVSEQEEQDSYIDEDEMAVILGEGSGVC